MSPPRLPYAMIRPLIHSGDLLLCSGQGPMSRMIQYATGSPYSHVGFLLRMETIDRLVVLESVESIGIRACTLDAYVTNYNGTGAPYPGALFVARHSQVDLADASRFLSFSHAAIDLLGYPYDTREIVGITARIVAQKLGMATSPPRTNQTYICSEYAALCFAAIGVAIPFDDLGFIAPRHFAECPEVGLLWEIEVG